MHAHAAALVVAAARGLHSATSIEPLTCASTCSTWAATPPPHPCRGGPRARIRPRGREGEREGVEAAWKPVVLLASIAGGTRSKGAAMRRFTGVKDLCAWAVVLTMACVPLPALAYYVS